MAIVNIQKTLRLKIWEASPFFPFFLFVIIFSVATFQRNNVWMDGIAFWSDVVRKSPAKARGHNNIGDALIDAGRCEDAIQFLLLSIKADPWYIEPHYNFAICHIKNSRFNNAINELKEVLRINEVLKKGHFGVIANPRYEIQAHSNLGNIYNVKRMFDKAVFHYREALNIEPNDISARFNLALTYEIMGMLREAGVEFEEVLKINPADEGAKRGVKRLEAISPPASGGQRQ